MVVKDKVMEDLAYAEYNLRQRYEITPGRTAARALQATCANQFVYKDGYWTPHDYEGFAIVSMVDNNPGNTFLSEDLQRIQQQLISLLDETIYFLLPADSFHQTIANTLSDVRFKENIEAPGKEAAYPSIVQNAFQHVPHTGDGAPIRMRLEGLSIFGTAIGILGVLEAAEDYKKITTFRSHFYNDPDLRALDVKMTRPFIGHITLAYIERVLTSPERDKLATAVNKINESLREHPLEFLISRAELRRYHHLAEFIRQEHYPVFHFTT